MNRKMLSKRTPGVVLVAVLFLCSAAAMMAHTSAAAVPPSFAGGNCGRPVCTWTSFGPQSYVRDTGQPVTVSSNFSILNPNTRYTLHVQNSGVSSAVISVNGVPVLGPSDFNPNVTTIDRAVSLQLNNEVDVQLRSKPGSSIILSIIGLDNDLPAISALATPVADTFGWNNTNVVVSFTCSDQTSGIASCPVPVTVSAEGATQTISGTAFDKAGNFAAASVTINLDKTPPAIAASPAPPANTFGWNNTSVTVTFICADVLSGVATCSPPVPFATEGANQTARGNATDKAGNTASTLAVINIDETPPTISAQASPVANAAGWNNTNVTVAFTCFDSLSGIATCPTQTLVTTEGANEKISGAAADKAGNTASASVNLNIDKTPPTVTTGISPQPNAAGWNNTNVTVSFQCSDALSGVATCPASQTVTSEGANQAISGTASDVAGNSAVATATINLDKTPPVISISSPANNSVSATPNLQITGTATDALSGVASTTCNGSAAVFQASSFNCPVSLGPGTNTITIVATDIAGNSSSQSLTVNLGPSITDFNPKSASAGTLISVSGSGFVSGTRGPQVVLNSQSGGTIAAPVASFTPTSINFIIPAGAASGPITVTTAEVSGVSAASLSVVASSGFALTASPTSANVQQGTSASVSVSLASNNGFSQLADLSVTGLPSGVTAKFSPVRITAGQFSILTISAPTSQAVGTAALTISAAATVEGIPTAQSANVSLNVQAPSTSLIGRIVESDNIETPIPGIIATFLGVDDAGHQTGCSGQTRSDAAGNFAFTNLSSACLGRQLVGYDGNSATDGEKYAGVNLAYTMISGQITGPELVHLPAISDAETIRVKQNATVDQVFSYSTIPGITVTVYAGTTLTLPDGTKPDPFPMAAVLVPVDRLPDAPAPTTGTLRASIVAFQPADTTSNQPVSVTFPNVVNTPPGVNMELDTLDPIVGELVKYGTGTVSADATKIVPDPDPAHPGHRFGISHFDWHGPMAPAPNSRNPSPDRKCPVCGDPVDTSSGVLVESNNDIGFGSARGHVGITRTYRTLSGAPGPFGVGTNHNYGYLLDVSNLVRGTGTFVTLVMPDGNQFRFTQQGSNVFTNSTIPSLLGAVVTRLSTSQYNLRWKNGTLFQFQTSSQGILLAFLNAITDANGNTITLVHGNSSQPIQITQIMDPVGRTLNASYDNFNRILSLTDPIGRTVQYTYNSQGTLATVTDPAGGVTTYAYDAQNRLSSITDPRKVVFVQNDYDGNGRVIRQTAADGGVTTFAYTLLNPTAETSPILLTTVTDPLGNQTIYHFNPQGFLVDSTNALGEKTVYTLDPGTNQVASITDPLGRMQTFAYDSAGNVTSVTRMAGTPSAVTTSFTYQTIFNKPTSITDPLGNTTNVLYDNAGNVISISDPLGQKTVFAYDSSGELTSTSDPLGNPTSYAYFNGLPTRITDPLGNMSTRSFDAAGRMTSVTTPLGQSTQLSYTALNLLTKSVDSMGGVTESTYDGNRNMLALTDPLGHTTSFTYDSMNRIQSKTDPLQRQQTYVYDLNGNLVSTTDRKNQTTTFAYDVLNRLQSVRFNATTRGGNSSAESTISYTYDAVNRMTQATDSTSGAIAETYDNLDRLISEKTAQGSISYSYDNAGRRTSMQVAGQPPVFYTYDNADRVTEIGQTSSSVKLSYDIASRRTSLTLPSGVIVSYAYDNASRLTTITYQFGSTVLGNLSYAYDQVGRRVQAGGSLARTGLPAVISAATYDAANELTNLNGLVLNYDQDGNLLSDGSNGFTWNARNQLAALNGTSLQYDAFGRRIKNAAGSAFLYDRLNAVQELLGTEATANLLNGGVDEIFGRADSSGVFTPLKDALGSAVALVDSSGNVQTSYTYDPFGNTSTSGAPNDNEFQYAGRENDANGLYYYRARFYDTSIDRFISEDPLGFRGGDINLYRYVWDSPTNFTDPIGEFGLGVSGGGSIEGGVGVAGAGGTGSVGAGVFTDWSSVSTGAFASGGAFAGDASAPSDPNDDNWAVGAYAGGGANVWISPNANNVCDLGGPFKTYSLNAGWGLRLLTIQVSVGQNAAGKTIWVFSYGGPLPGVAVPTGGGFGVSLSAYNTNTVTTGRGCRCK